MAKIKILKSGKIYNFKAGIELVQAYRIDASLPLKFACCNGECGTCVIKVVEGIENLSKATKQERATLSKKNLSLSQYRLACQCSLLNDITIE